MQLSQTPQPGVLHSCPIGFVQTRPLQQSPVPPHVAETPPHCWQVPPEVQVRPKQQPGVAPCVQDWPE